MILVADSSALLAILLGEPERADFKRFLLEHEVKTSAGTLTETLRIAQLRGSDPKRCLGSTSCWRRVLTEIVPVDADQLAVWPGKACFALARAVPRNLRF